MPGSGVFQTDDLSDDLFLGGRLRLWQPRQGYRAATDPVFLAAACPARPGESVLDLGCGAGAAALCLGARVAGVALAGLEVQPAYADLARRNAARNGQAFEVVEGDLTALPAVLRRDFDHVISNPPYYPAGGTPSPRPDRAQAMQVQAAPLAQWLAVAARRLRPGGWLTMITGADALPELLAGLGTLGSAAVLPLQPREGRAAKRVILQARKGGKAPFRLLTPVVIHHGATHDGDRESYSALAGDVLRKGCDLLAQFR